MNRKQKKTDEQFNKYNDGDLLRSMSFNIGIAKLLDINSALVYQNIAFWVKHNSIKERNLYNERYWTCLTIEDMSERVECLNREQIKYSISKLEEYGFIESRVINWSGNTWDRTKSYTISNEWQSKFQQCNVKNSTMDSENLNNDNVKNSTMNIKDITKDSKKDKEEKNTTNDIQTNNKSQSTNNISTSQVINKSTKEDQLNSTDKLSKPKLTSVNEFYKEIKARFGKDVKHSILDDAKLYDIMSKLKVSPSEKNEALFNECLGLAEKYNAILQKYPNFQSDNIDKFERDQLVACGFNIVNLYNKNKVIQSVYEKLTNKRLLNKDKVKVQDTTTECVETQNIRFKGLSKKQIEVITKYEKDNNEIVEESDFYLILKHFGG